MNSEEKQWSKRAGCWERLHKFCEFFFFYFFFLPLGKELWKLLFSIRFFHCIFEDFFLSRDFLFIALFTPSNDAFPQQCSSNSTFLSHLCYLLESTQTHTIQRHSVSSHLTPHLLTPGCTSQAQAPRTSLHLRSRSTGSPSSLEGEQKEGRTARIVLTGLALGKSHFSRLTLGETKRW